MEEALYRLALSVVGGAVGSLLTMWLGWRQFRSQRWWDKKAEAYAALIDAFHPLLDEDAAYDEEMERNRELSEEAKAALRTAADEGEKKIRRQQRLSSLLICDQADKALRTMFRQLDAAGNTTDWVEFRTNYSIALWGGFEALKKCAVEDLKVG
jgi:hypothetical protein